jgi:hypothetical protein
MTRLRTEQGVNKLKQEVSKSGILQQPIGTCKFPQGICKEFFKFAKLMRKIPNELGSQKRIERFM